MLLKKICEKINNTLSEYYKIGSLERLEILVNVDQKKINFGDISINAPLILAKEKKINPLVIAEELKKILLFEEIEKIEIAGGGFLNFFLKESFFNDCLIAFSSNKSFFEKESFSLNYYNLEFVSANPTGPLHIGHGRGAIIGDILGRVLNLKGYLVTREYYINDAGAQIAKLGNSLFAAYQIECGKEVAIPEDGYHGYYIKDLASGLFKKHGEGLLNKELSFFSDYAKEILLKNIKDTLSQYQVEFDIWFSEKKLHETKAIEEAVMLLEKKGFIFTSEDGAIWFKATAFGDEKDRVLKKNNGDWTYTAADIAYFLDKINRGFTTIVMVLGQDHHSFKIRMEAIAQAFSFNLQNLQIILYQLVTLRHEGELFRMSKRKGNSVELETVIDTVGSDVARFFYLQRKADAHLDFDIKEALEKNINNPVFYIQYAMVRIKSIFEKATPFVSEQDLLFQEDHSFVFSPIEKLILKQISQLDSVLDKIATHFAPHLITYFTLELTALFHVWYNAEQIITADDRKKMKKKLLLLEVTKNCLEICVSILGIDIPDKM